MRLRSVLLVLLALSTVPSGGADAQMREDAEGVELRNDFAANVLTAHRSRLDAGDVRESSRVGGYARMPEYFTEVEYRGRGDGRLLSRIRWVREQPDTAQMIELFHYDDRGRVSVDYFISYLTEFRNAPLYALINVHAYNEDLHAFRQFDVEGDILFERCEGSHRGAAVDVAIEDGLSAAAAGVDGDVYDACFGGLPRSVDAHKDARRVVSAGGER